MKQTENNGITKFIIEGELRLQGDSLYFMIPELDKNGVQESISLNELINIFLEHEIRLSIEYLNVSDFIS